MLKRRCARDEASSLRAEPANTVYSVALHVAMATNVVAEYGHCP